jgi:hypothetical protein
MGIYSVLLYDYMAYIKDASLSGIIPHFLGGCGAPERTIFEGES